MTQRTDPKLWDSIKDKILKEDIAGTKPNQWSARKAQLLAVEYKKKGGGYK